MATQAEYNQFKRYVGDYGKDLVDESEIDEYLNDAAAELTADFTVPVTDFTILVHQYHPEVIVYAAILFWWNKASKLVDHHSQRVGQASHDASEKWDRAMQMIARLEERFQMTQTLGTDITVGNLSRFSKLTLTRFGGQSEENALNS